MRQRDQPRHALTAITEVTNSRNQSDAGSRAVPSHDGDERQHAAQSAADPRIDSGAQLGQADTCHASSRPQPTM